LFYDVSANAANDGSGPIAAFQPTVREVKPQFDQLEGINVPQWQWDVPEQKNGDEDETIMETLEWLSLASQLSPRIQTADAIDPYLSRYKSPATTLEAPGIEKTLCRLRWHGLITNHFALKVFIAMLKTSGNEWASMSISTFAEISYTVLFEKDQCMIWEYHD
jgi:ribonuclease P/MRP protein subunit RPP40